jgi:hypothetical protein
VDSDETFGQTHFHGCYGTCSGRAIGGLRRGIHSTTTGINCNAAIVDDSGGCYFHGYGSGNDIPELRSYSERLDCQGAHAGCASSHQK